MLETVTVKVAYMGIRIDHQGKKTYEYVDLQSHKRYSFGKRKIARREFIGAIIESKKTGDTFSDSKVVGHLRQGDMHYENIGAWQAEERVALEHSAAISYGKKETAKIDRLIKELRDCTVMMSSRERAVFARYVFENLL